MDPSLNMCLIDDDLEISTLLDTSNTILNTVDLTTAWVDEFDLDLFNSQHAIEEISSSREDDEFVPPSLPQPQESADYVDFQNNSDDISTEIFINPPASQTFDESLASSNMIVIHTIDEITDSQCIIQENSSSWEKELVLQPLLQESENLNDYAINSPASLTIDKPHTSPDIYNMLAVNNISLDSPELLIVNEISSESPNITIIPNIMKANDATTSSDIGIKKRKSVGKPSGNILKKKLKISPPSDEVAIPTTSTPSVPTITRKTKNKKIAKDPHDMPAKIDMLKKMNMETSKYTFIVRSTNKTNAVCKAVMRDNVLLEDFATVTIQIEKHEKNQEVARRVCYKKSAIFQSKFKAFLKSKVKEILKIGNIVTSEHYIVEYKSRIIISVRVRNTCLIGPEIANEIVKLCDTCLSNDVMIVFSGNT